jgi:hypothetical protein
MEEKKKYGDMVRWREEIQRREAEGLCKDCKRELELGLEVEVEVDGRSGSGKRVRSGL